MAPWAQVCYFADCRWWNWHRDKPEFIAFTGEKASIEGNAGNCDVAIGEAFGREVEEGRISLLHNYGVKGLSTLRNGVYTGGHNSGHQALNIAVLAGAARVLLLGYDMKFGADGRDHWFGKHPIWTEPQAAYFTSMIDGFRHAARALANRNIEVINCSPDTALDCFKKEELGKVLARLVPDPVATALP